MAGDNNGDRTTERAVFGSGTWFVQGVPVVVWGGPG